MEKITIVAKIIGKNFFTVSTNRKSYTIQRENGLYETGVALLKAGNYSDLLDLLDKPQALAKYSFGKVQVYDGEIRYNGKVMNGYLANQILEMAKEQMPFEPVVAFLNNVMENPNSYVQEDLYKFLEYGNMPLTDDGHFLAYKYVNNNFRDCYTDTFDNSVGKVVSIDRSAVVEDRGRGCAAGLHVGTLQYVTGNGKKIVIVKVNPKDIVSIPTDYNFQKIRTCRYEVIGEYEAPLSKPVMIDSKTAYTSKTTNDSVNYEISVDFKKPSNDEYNEYDEENDDLFEEEDEVETTTDAVKIMKSMIKDATIEEKEAMAPTEIEALEEYVIRGEEGVRTLKQIQSRFRRKSYTLENIITLVESSENLILYPNDDVGRKHWEVEYIA